MQDEANWRAILPNLLEGNALLGPSSAVLDEGSARQLERQLKMHNVTYRELREAFYVELGEQRFDGYYCPRLMAALSERFERLLP